MSHPSKHSISERYSQCPDLGSTLGRRAEVEPLILQRGSKPLTLGHNALIRAKGYSQRWMAETSYSTTKRSLGDAVRALGWYRQFREIALMFAISNIEPLCEPL